LGYDRVDNDGETYYRSFSQVDGEDETRYRVKSYKDSYLLKATQHPGDILSVYLVYRIGSWSYSGSALPPDRTGFLTGTVTWGGSLGNKPCIRGAGTSFTTELMSGYYVWRPDTPSIPMKVDEVISNKLATLRHAPNAVGYSGPAGADGAGATPYCNPHAEYLGNLPQYTHAQPFVKLGDLYVYGDEHTMLAEKRERFQGGAVGGTTYWYQVARPGGGPFTKEDFKTMEVGIILETSLEIAMSPDGVKSWPIPWCSQIGLALVESRARRMDTSVGINEWGLEVVDAGLEGVGIDPFGWQYEYGYNEFGIQVDAPSGEYGYWVELERMMDCKTQRPVRRSAIRVPMLGGAR
jgi:hypothetical protein